MKVKGPKENRDCLSPNLRGARAVTEKFYALFEGSISTCLLPSLLAILFGISPLLGCSTTQDAADRINQQFAGQPVDSFFLKYGMPDRKFQLNDGEMIYGWSSQIHSYTMPATTTVQANSTPSGFTGTAQTIGGGSLNVFCTLEIVASPEGTIKQIKVMGDTLGDWTLSRCAEIFKE